MSAPKLLFLIVSICNLATFCSAGWKSSTFKSSTFGRAVLKSASTIIVGAGLSMPFNIPAAQAFGPVELTVNIRGYSQVELCNGQKPLMPGQKAMEGLFPVCIQVEADVVNPDKTKSLKDVSVYGFVKEDAAGNSVLPNNPDFKSDSGQYAMIKLVPPGKRDIIISASISMAVSSARVELKSLSN